MRILLIDDEELGLKAISGFLAHQLGHDVTECRDSSEALKIYKSNPFPLVISDIRMPGINGIELSRYIKGLPESQFTDVVLITGYGNMDSAIQALRAGAYDFLLKPIDVEELASIVIRVEEHLSLLKENRDLKLHFEHEVHQATSEVREKYERIKSAYSKIVGIGNTGIFSEKMREIRELAEKLHHDRSLPVLIEGETGTGKEVVARMVHYGQGEVTTPFVSINCTAIPANLFETELFGYVEGAFTDAKKKGTMGKFELAQGGTIFLDELGDLPLEIQPKLLRVLEERAIYRVGGLKKIELDIRVICATNQNLLQKVKEGRFREDLFYRLNVAYIKVPPLRERKEAIAPLAQLFLSQYAEKKNRRFRFLHRDAVNILEEYPWPGNIRELQNTIERVVMLYDDIEIRPEHLRFLTDSTGDNHWNQWDTDVSETGMLEPGKFNLPPDKLDLKTLEEEIVQKALVKFNGNKTKTAQYLGLTRSALRSKLK
ncbi:MAG: response regulator [Candidatus Aminicenantes bacterium]|nr:response regulator [Candidatus Aminicenantes bacterium]NIM81985.1 response regulator [Candidatus Aminicenantes bacterium]NIN21373.1 response regulator [Candidatus Aminicenantes bacterium]NIN45194.1 response regulator [Candidatus Aminicenantes bacterium]NIN88011.1 response regulator [Candidatus Aminicenantes bacterium]